MPKEQQEGRVQGKDIGCFLALCGQIGMLVQGWLLNAVRHLNLGLCTCLRNVVKTQCWLLSLKIDSINPGFLMFGFLVLVWGPGGVGWECI